MNKDALVGTRIREYEIIESIGKGGMGAVYKARHVLLQKERAIKVIQSFLAGDQDHRDRFIREARILSELNHPNLVQLYEFGTLDENTLFMVMEFVRGESVLKRMQRMGKIPIQESVRIARQAAAGLHSAHAKGIIHRDISPDNLMLVKDESGAEITKVIDFGIAKPLAGEAKQFTATDMFLGKPEYCSPEQTGILEEGSSIDHRSDIYSLAVTLYYMLVGKLPFYSPTPMGYLVKHATEPPRPMLSFSLPGLPESLDRVILKALSKNRNDRQSSMLEFAQDLERAFQSAEPGTSPTPIPAEQIPTIGTRPTVAIPPAQETDRKTKPNVVMWIVLGLVALIAVAGSFLLLTKKAGKEEPQKGNRITKDFSPAIASSDVDAVKALIQEGADVNAAGPSGETPLLQAAMINNADVVQALLDAGANVNMGDKDGFTPLMKSAYWGYSDNVEALLRADAEINAKNSNAGETAIFGAVEGARPDVIQILIRGGADLAIRNKSGETPLMSASGKDRSDVLQLLVQAGADVNAAEQTGVTPLMRSSYWGYEDNVKLLLQAGANVNAKATSNHATALMNAVEGSRPKIIPLLIQAGADLEAKDKSGDTALLTAASKDRADVVKLLIAAGSNVNAMNDSGVTPLMQSSYWGYEENIEALIQARADVNVAASTTGENALMKAAEGGRVEVLPILIQAGADVQAKDKSEGTALKRAGQYGDAAKREAMVAILQKAGAKD